MVNKLSLRFLELRSEHKMRHRSSESRRGNNSMTALVTDTADSEDSDASTTAKIRGGPHGAGS